MRSIALVIGLAVGGTMAQGQEVQLIVPGAPDSLITTLQSASLIYDLKADTETTASPQDYVAAARADYARLLTGLYAQGYYGGTISILLDGREAAGIAPLDAPTVLNSVTIQVVPGPQFTFGQTRIAPLASGTELPAAFGPGEIARSETIRAAVTASVNAWEDAGHAKAAAAGQQITARHPANVLDVQVAIAPGPELTFGALTVTGNENVRTARIIDIAGLPSGEVYSPDDVDRAAARLRRTGAFSSVAFVESDTIGPNDTLPFEVQVVEQKRRRLGFGAELSSLEGLALSAFLLNRNLLGGAERLRYDAEIAGIGGGTGGIDYSLGVSFLRPRTFNVDTDLYANAKIEQRDEPDYFINKFSAAVGLNRLIGTDLTVSGGIGFETAEVDDGLGLRRYTILTLPITGTLDRRDDPLDAKAGYYIDAEVTPFVGLTGSDSGARLYADARVYRSFGADQRVTLAFRGQVGSLLGASAASSPTDFLFYSGGGGSVRGQAYQSLGVDVGGVTVGGLSLFNASVEARVQVRPKIGIVGFYDYGYVSPGSTPLTGGNDHAGAGIGVRYATRIGPIRLDLATPVSGADAGGSVQIYIGIGQSF